MEVDNWNSPYLWPFLWHICVCDFVHTHTYMRRHGQSIGIKWRNVRVQMCECVVQSAATDLKCGLSLLSVWSDRMCDATPACLCLCFHLWDEWRPYEQGSTRIYDHWPTNIPVFVCLQFFYMYCTTPSLFHCLLWFGSWTDSLEFAFKVAHVTHDSNCSKYIRT